MARLLGLSGAVVSGTSYSTATEALPLGSVCTRFSCSPCCAAGSRSIRKVPLALTTPEPMTLPSASRTSTVAPGSPRPLRAVPPGPTRMSVTASGGVMSGAVNSSGIELLPAASTWRMSRASPLAWAGERARLKVPSALTRPLPMRLPAASRTCTVAPGSPRPVRVTPFARARSVGWSGALVSGLSTSGAVMLAAGEVLPAASAALTSRAWPSVCGGCRVMLNWPSAPATAVPSTTPPVPRTETVEPGSARPVRVVPCSLMARSVGASGAVASGAVTVPGAETLPAPSVKVTSRFSLLICGGFNVTLKLPSAPTVPLPIRLPAASRIFTVLPASPRPVRRRPSGDTSRSMGVAGAVVSGSEPPPLLPPPPLSAAAAAPPTPSRLSPAIAQVGMALPAVPIPATSSSSEATSSKVKPVNAAASYWACHRVPSSPTKTMSLPTPAWSTAKKLPTVTFSPDFRVMIRSCPRWVTVATLSGDTGICTTPGALRLILPQAL